MAMGAAVAVAIGGCMPAGIAVAVAVAVAVATAGCVSAGIEIAAPDAGTAVATIAGPGEDISVAPGLS